MPERTKAMDQAERAAHHHAQDPHSPCSHNLAHTTPRVSPKLRPTAFGFTVIEVSRSNHDEGDKDACHNCVHFLGKTTTWSGSKTTVGKMRIRIRRPATAPRTSSSRGYSRCNRNITTLSSRRFITIAMNTQVG